jgi:hypothetical protein
MFNLPDDFDQLGDKVKEFEYRLKKIEKKNAKIYKCMSLVSDRVHNLKI